MPHASPATMPRSAWRKSSPVNGSGYGDEFSHSSFSGTLVFSSDGEMTHFSSANRSRGFTIRLQLPSLISALSSGSNQLLLICNCICYARTLSLLTSFPRASLLSANWPFLGGSAWLWLIHFRACPFQRCFSARVVWLVCPVSLIPLSISKYSF